MNDLIVCLLTLGSSKEIQAGKKSSCHFLFQYKEEKCFLVKTEQKHYQTCTLKKIQAYDENKKIDFCDYKINP